MNLEPVSPFILAANQLPQKQGHKRNVLKPTQKPPAQKWQYTKDAQEFHKKHGRKSYTMTWNVTVEAEMMDKSLPKEARVLAAIRRYSWGNLSDFAVDAMPQKKPLDPKPESLSQQRLGDILGLRPASMSEAVTFLKERGYLRKDHPFLFPEDSVSLLDASESLPLDSNSTKSDSPYLRYEREYLEKNPEARTNLTKLDKKRKRFQDAAKAATSRINKIKRVILFEWKENERKTKDLGSDEKEGGNSLRSCAPAQYEGEQEAKSTYDHVLPLDSNSMQESFATPDATIRPLTNPKNGNPPETIVSAPRSFKDVNLKESFALNVGGATTTLEASVSSEAASVRPSPLPSESLSEEQPAATVREKAWHQSLSSEFRKAGKGLPTRNQSADAYRAAAPHWDEFLRWLATAPAFQETKHPGGLPSLVEMFLADRMAEPVTAAAPQTRARKKNSVSEKLKGWKGEQAS